jgi:hypothetical protein
MWNSDRSDSDRGAHGKRALAGVVAGFIENHVLIKKWQAP